MKLVERVTFVTAATAVQGACGSEGSSGTGTPTVPVTPRPDFACASSLAIFECPAGLLQSCTACGCGAADDFGTSDSADVFSKDPGVGGY